MRNADYIAVINPMFSGLIHQLRWSVFSVLLVAFALAMPATAISQDVTGSTNSVHEVASGQHSTQFSEGLRLINAERHADAYIYGRGMARAEERRAIQWAAIYFGRGDVDAESVLRFATDAPDLGSSGLYRTRLEQAVLKEPTNYQRAIQLLGGQMPNLVDAQILLGTAYVQTGQRERGLGIIRQIWTSEFLSTEQESLIAGTFAPLLTNDDHWARAVHLMMHDRVSGALRLTNYLSAAQNSLVAARTSVARRNGDAQAKLNAVDPSLRAHPVFHFSRGQFARRQGDISGAVDLFNQVGDGPLPDSAEWWYERRYLARVLLAANKPQDAYRLVSAYQTGPEGRVVDANLHAGWLALHYLGNPRAAVTHFEKMRSLSTLESSVTKSNYWLGRALVANGDTAEANRAFQRAAAYPTSYYGLLSAYRLGKRQVDIRPMPDPNGRIAHFDNLQLVKVIRLFASAGQPKLAEPLLSRLIYSVADGGDMVLTARLAQNLNAHNLAVLMADIAEQRGMPMDLFNYPRDGIPSINELNGIDPAAVYAVARQESKFDFDVISSAGARGLMQLMPATAQETANRLGVAYSSSRLTADPDYNALLGSTYLRGQLSRYDNSLILASAAYNAGAGNVNKWVNLYGNPTSPNVDPVLWIELIPFAETRNYVQRVVANFMVYRARLGLEQMTIADVLRRI